MFLEVTSLLAHSRATPRQCQSLPLPWRQMPSLRFNGCCLFCLSRVTLSTLLYKQKTDQVTLLFTQPHLYLLHLEFMYSLDVFLPIAEKKKTQTVRHSASAACCANVVAVSTREGQWSYRMGLTPRKRT